MNLTSAIVIAGTGCRAATADLWLSSLQSACEKFGIETNNAMAAFLANIGVESQSLTVFAEDMNYSAQALANTWPQRFAANPKAMKMAPNVLATSIAYKPQTIANLVYANRMGNGDVASGDGWNFRGQGPIQLTGRQMFTTLAGILKLPLVQHPELLQQPGEGAQGAAWFFYSRRCIAYANENNFAAVVKAINGAAPTAANQGPLREARYKAALAAITAPVTSASTTSVAASTPAPPTKE
jgi:putative chitinase